jgi:3-oxoacyl-[acyl-carrier protein] reductase
LRTVDVTDEHSVATALAADVEDFGRIDAFVNNAGILGEVLPLWETTPADFRRVLEVNLVGAYLCLRAVLDVMRRQDARPLRGHVVNVASIQGKEGMARAGAYSASKAGLIALTKTAGKEGGPLGIMVNCVTPAAAETAMAKELSDERRGEILARIPLGRFVDVDEIARLSLFLCTDDCSFSAGAVFDVSGGRATY